jgi:hypothetical protein
MRVYTWGKKRERYETAYVESGLCGKLPVTVKDSSQGATDTAFSFTNIGTDGAAERDYVMHQTIVRRVKQAGEAKPKSRKRKR